MRMVWLMVMAACVLAPGAGALAQDGANLDQMKKMYRTR